MSAYPNNAYAIILAAGASRRMGSPKQLLAWGHRTLLENAIANSQAVFANRVVVVLGANAEIIQNAVDLDTVTTIFNPDWQEGIASSIRAGIQALPTSATAALLQLCDQPLINAQHLLKLLQGWQSATDKIIVSQFQNGMGVPAVFPAQFFQYLLSLKGDSGAKQLLKQFETSLLKISLPEAAHDVDNLAAFNQLTMQHALKGSIITNTD